MTDKKICPVLIVVVLSMVVLLGVPVAADNGAAAQPQLPHGFYGKVEVGGSLAGQGLVVEAVGPGVRSNIQGNPVSTLADGSYGAVGATSQKLVVQGDVEPGTPLEFYVGGMLAEVFNVAVGGEWKQNYSYTPGELTELNLRVGSLPSAGQTREPTPVETRLPAEQVPAGYVYTGPSLPQPGVVETYIPGQSTGNQPAAGSTHTPDNSGQIPAQGGVHADQTVEGSIPVLPVDTGSTGMLIGAGVVTIIVVLGGIFYYLNKKQSGNNKKEG
jgi:hypothetical protein